MSIDPLNSGLSGLEASQTQVDVSANNIANVATPGFQSQDVTFADMLAGSIAARTQTNPASGGLDPTGLGTNVAIAGPGYFALQGGNSGPTYTRAGDFTVGANGLLVDGALGLAVASTSGQPIAVPAGVANLSIARDGTVSADLPDGQTTTLGRLALATFPNGGGLARVGGGFVVSATSGSAQLGAPATPGYGALAPGFLESSKSGRSATPAKPRPVAG